jgi:hypothetical protein
MIKTWSIYSGIWLAEKGDPMGNIFGVCSQCKSRTFLVDLNGTNIWWCILPG